MQHQPYLGMNKVYCTAVVHDRSKIYGSYIHAMLRYVLLMHAQHGALPRPDSPSSQLPNHPLNVL